jgi:hypothetical protein
MFPNNMPFVEIRVISGKLNSHAKFKIGLKCFLAILTSFNSISGYYFSLSMFFSLFVHVSGQILSLQNALVLPLF